MTSQITGHTGLYALLGSPVAHSISPMMHNEAFRLLGIDAVYLAFDVGTDHFAQAVNGLRQVNIKGFNVTMPNKNLMAELADELSPAARLGGAVNTVVNDNGRLIGHTTDGIGYMMAAKDAGVELKGKTMTLLGAGGAATAIVVQAALDGMKEIRVFNLKDGFYDRICKIAEQLNKETDCRVTVSDLADMAALKDSVQTSDILTNCTNVGMAPNTDACPIHDTGIFRPSLIVSDIIYNPAQNMLLKKAKACGCRTFNGMYMLLYQGAASFRLWTGKDMPVTQIKAKFF